MGCHAMRIVVSYSATGLTNCVMQGNSVFFLFGFEFLGAASLLFLSR